MEYTKDMILQVRYGEINRTLKNKKEKRTSKFLEGIQKHKLMTTAVISAIIFISIDVMLITNFMHILSLV
ncbi:MAG: hypothetical protein HFJ32_04880 [Clostridia bacterium]|nr:hypothetical protein [Clostridia bacterium]